MIGKQITAWQLTELWAHNNAIIKQIKFTASSNMGITSKYIDRYPTASMTNNPPRDRYPACHPEVLRRQVPVAAIFGQEVGPAALVPLVGASFFNLLQWRIFSDCGVAVSATASPMVSSPVEAAVVAPLAGQRSSAATSDSIAFLCVTVGCCVQNCRTLL